MSHESLSLQVLPSERTVHARVRSENVRLLGFIPAHTYSTAAINEALQRLTLTGTWYLWITDQQVKLGGLGRAKDFESPFKRYRRVPLDREWFERHGIGALSAGEYFFLTRGEGELSAEDFKPQPSPRVLPAGASAFVAIDPDIEWFDAVFSDDWFDEAVALVSGD